MFQLLQTNLRDALRHAHPMVLYTTADAHCDKLTMVRRTKLTTLATVDVAWRNFSKSRLWTKFSWEVPLFLEIPIP